MRLTVPALLRPDSTQVLAAEAEEAKHPLWDIRTHAQAEQFWKRVRVGATEGAPATVWVLEGLGERPQGSSM